MHGRYGQAQQYLVFQQPYHIHVFVRQDAIKVLLVVIQLVEAGLITRQQTNFMVYRIIKRTETALATQLTAAVKTDIQHRTPKMIHSALHAIIQNALPAVQQILQTRQFGKRDLTAYPPAITGKIQAVYTGPCVHEPRIL